MLKIICLIQFIIDIMFNSNLLKHGQEMEILYLINMGKSFSLDTMYFPVLFSIEVVAVLVYPYKIYSVFSSERLIFQPFILLNLKRKQLIKRGLE